MILLKRMKEVKRVKKKKIECIVCNKPLLFESKHLSKVINICFDCMFGLKGKVKDIDYKVVYEDSYSC